MIAHALLKYMILKTFIKDLIILLIVIKADTTNKTKNAKIVLN